MLERFYSRPKNRKLAIALALLSVLVPLPIAGLHKFYLGQPLWGGLYLLLWQTPMPRIACAIDAVWYFVQGAEDFHCQYNQSLPYPQSAVLSSQPPVVGLAASLRELEKLRSEGLLSEYEFEQKRRQLVDRPV
jgi:TM2 domain-containing membrane protein YozV